MINTLPRQSIWEIACRSNDLDPSMVDIKNLPLKLKDALKSIARATHYDEKMSVLNSNGIENHSAFHPKTHKRYDPKDIHSKINDCYEKESFDKEFLETVFIEDEHFANWCINKNIPLPTFWFPNGWKPFDFEEKTLTVNVVDKDNKLDINLRPSQADKIACQAIGRTLWDMYPNMTIAAMCMHEAIQKYGNGKIYKGAHTLRDWLSEVAPENVKGKKGRPKKSES
ncbi:MAG: hypothetical protein PSV17_09850 [Methylotenera sp.]|uniref:hypothetical protein n=1 Tax=Methylotenera sp. TaxID=2051956 RepID=UPI002488BE6C|nr:hypothetical protein [Methylotenera sp.]MDI1309720.1 hypothetical protein [Methylotenera sp.]